MTPEIIYQDNDLIIINKPVGMVVNRAESVKQETVQDFIEKRFQEFGFKYSPEDTEFISRAGIVHRIDKETSGILIIAKTPQSFRALQTQFKERDIQKTYLAIVHGVVPDEGEINAPIGRLPWNKEHFGVVPGGKESLTRYKRIKTGLLEIEGKTEQVSVVEVFPKTGRTHQIRVHFKYIGHPLLGDYLYAGRKQGRNDRVENKRVMLHAYKISILHPTTSKPLAFEAPIPEDIHDSIERIHT